MKHRVFAVVSTAVLLLVGLQAVFNPVSASDLPSTPATEGTIYGPGYAITNRPDGSALSQYLPTFLRWDGVWLPVASLNRSTGDWPYLLTDTPTTVSATVLGLAFNQAKVPGATYEYLPERIKETIEFPAAPQSPTIAIPFTTTGLDVSIGGGAIALSLPDGQTVWTASDFHAWDSSPNPQTWPSAVDAIAYANGVLSLTLDAELLADAVYPLYVDPTWTLSSSLGWGASVFQDATEDRGDHEVKIGWLADNFNDNLNEIWTIQSGAVTFAGGVMQMPGSSAVRAGDPWYDQKAKLRVEFSSLGGIGLVFRRDVASDSRYQVYISGSTGYVGLEKWVGGTGTTLGSFITTITTGVSYEVGVVALGNTFEVWWQAVRRLEVTDPSPPAPFSGHIQIWTSSSAQIKVDSVRVWNPPIGTMTTPVRDAGTNRPLEVKVGGTVDDANDQYHLRIRSSADNVAWGPWTNLKSDVSPGVFHKVPDQDRQRYYQLRVTLTSGDSATPDLSELTTTEGTPTTSPTSNTGFESWYPYVGGMANAVNGNLWYSKRDMSIQARAFSLGIAQSYNSLRGSEVGPLGKGWTHNYNEKLVVNPDQTVTWNDGDGSQHTFTPKNAPDAYGPPRGITSRLVKNDDGSYALWHTDATKADFTSAGRLSKITDKNGNKVTLTYDGNGRLTSVADDSGKSLTLGYDASNRITTVTDPMSRQITYTYDGSGNLVAVRDAMGFYENYTYVSGRMSEIIDPVGKRMAFAYDGSSRVKEIRLGLYQGGQVVWSFRQYWIAYSTLTTRTIINARGFTTSLTLNSFGNPTQASGPSIGSACCDGQGNSSAYVWDGEMNKIRTTDGRGNALTMDYDHRSSLVSTTDAGGNVSSSVWGERNYGTWYSVLLFSQTNFRGYTTSYTYNGKDNLIVIRNAKNQESYLYYDAFGLLNRSKDFRWFSTWFEYNNHGYQTKATSPLNEVTLHGYDAVGRQTTVTSPLGFVTTTAYDANDRVTRTTDPLGNFTTFDYNARGDRTKTTDPEGHATFYSVNVTNGRVQVVTDALGNQTTLAYDLRGNLVSVWDANDRVTTYAYDAFDRQTTATSPMGFATSYRYDAAGNRIGRTDANGASTTYSFDMSNRLISIVYAGGTTVTYGYDKNSNPTSEAGFGYAKTSAYDELDRMTSVTMDYGTFAKPTTYTYDANGNRRTMVDPESGTTSYDYDAVNRQWRITDPEGRQTTYVYDKDSRVTSTTYANGVVTTNSWDAASRLTKVETRKSDDTLIDSFEYAYDKSGNRLSVKLADGSMTSYEYDDLRRLLKMTEPGVVTTYEYDAVGNLLEETQGSTTKTYSYDADDRLWDITVGGAGMRYGHDANGNRIWAYDKATAVNTSFSYDYENRMTARGTCSYTYAPNGERMSSQCSAPTYYRYDSVAAGGMSDAVAEYDSAGARQARYTHGPSADEPVGLLRSGSHYTYQRDGLGSVSKITDASQATVNAYAYSPWGDTNSSGSLQNPYKYTSREADSGSTLYHYRARVYDPEARRFLQKDPAGMVDGPNQYAYAGDNPVCHTDPSGKWILPFRWRFPTEIWTPVPCGWYWDWWGFHFRWLYFRVDVFGTCLMEQALKAIAHQGFEALYKMVWMCAFGMVFICWSMILSAVITGVGWLAAISCVLAFCTVLTIWFLQCAFEGFRKGSCR